MPSSSRRKLIYLGSVVGLGGLSGCLGGERTVPSVDSDEPTVDPGASYRVTVQARNVDEFSFETSFLDSEHLEVTAFSVTPDPDSQDDRFPPIWYWADPRSNVDAEMEVQVAAGAPADEYSYEVTASNGDQEVSETFGITIRS